MSKNQNIICVSNTAWDTNFLQSTTQLLSLMATEKKVLYVDYPYTFKDLKNSLLGKRKLDIKRIIGFLPRIRIFKTNFNSEVYVLSIPPILSINWINNESLFNFFNKFNCWIITSTIKKYQKK